MSTDLFFSQPIPQNPSTGIQSDNIGPSGPDRSSRIQTFHESPKGDKDNFLSTMKQVVQDRSPTKRPQHVAESRSSKATATVVGGKIDDASDHEASAADAPAQTEKDAKPDQRATEWNFTAFIKVLERMGFHDAIGASDLQNMADGNPVDNHQITAIKSLFARLQEHQMGSTADLKAGLEQLQQFIATAIRPRDGISSQGLNPSQVSDLKFITTALRSLDENSGQGLSPSQVTDLEFITTALRSLDGNSGHGPSPSQVTDLESITTALQSLDGNSGQGLSPSQVADLARMNQWLKGLTLGLQAQNGNAGLLTGLGAGGVNAAGAIAAEVEGNGATAVKSLALNGNSAATATFPSTENSAVQSQSENLSEPNQKVTAASQPLVAKDDQAPKAAPAVERAAADASKNKESMDLGRVARIANRTDVSGRIATAPDPDQQAGTAGMRDNPSIKSSASSGPDPAVVKISESQSQSTSGEEPLSKVFQGAQSAKESVVRVESGTSEETVSKIVKTEAGTSDNGLLNSSGHNTEKVAEPASVPKETSQSELRNQALDQIVRKAAIHLRNGQHEARIELKPDFLGQIRMQVISENQQVTVKILAEHGFVKDMIERNVHQLKVDLQQQGLEVNKLEVSVSRDPEDSGNFKDKFAQSKARQNHAGRQSEDQSAPEEQRQTGAPVRTADGATTVDYFA